LFSARTTVNKSILVLNEAEGYHGGMGQLQTLVTLNEAKGSTGIGGGVYTLGAFTPDASTLVVLNQASTSADNVGP
jgi:hypothetical protein